MGYGLGTSRDDRSTGFRFALRTDAALTGNPVSAGNSLSAGQKPEQNPLQIS